MKKGKLARRPWTIRGMRFVLRVAADWRSGCFGAPHSF